MAENNIEIKNNTIIHKDNSINRLDLSFLKHIELEEYKKSDYWLIGLMTLQFTTMKKELLIFQNLVYFLVEIL